MGFFDSTSWARASGVHTLAKCGACGLCKQCFSPRMPPTGKGRRKILFVAEAPGVEEDKKGVQLIGKAGECLRKMLREIGEDLEDCTKTNAVICRPPNNEIDDVYIESCRPNLLKTIQEIKPNVIILLGMSAVKALVPMEWKRDIGQIGQWVGWAIPSPTFNAWLCPTYHPSYVSRTNEDPALVRIVKEHLRRAFALEDKRPPITPLAALQSQVAVVTLPSAGRLLMRSLEEATGVLAFDYEATGLKPEDTRHRIVSCSFCLDGEQTFACPIDEKGLKILSRVLRNEKTRKVASNLKFEERWTRTKLGHGVANWFWDTMLAAHVLDNRPGICSVKFQAYVRLGIPDYDSHIEPYLEGVGKTGFNRIHLIDPKELLLYNGMDSLLEYKVMAQQREELQWSI